MKYNRMIEKEDNGLKLEDKKFEHSKEMEGKRWDHSMKLDDKKLEMEKEEKAKDRDFELQKLDRQSNAEAQAKKMEVLVKCLDSGKSMEDIERIAKLFN